MLIAPHETIGTIADPHDEFVLVGTEPSLYSSTMTSAGILSFAIHPFGHIVWNDNDEALVGVLRIEKYGTQNSHQLGWIL